MILFSLCVVFRAVSLVCFVSSILVLYLRVCACVCVGNKLLITSITQSTTEDRMDEEERDNHDYYALLHQCVCLKKSRQKVSMGIITRRK